MVIVLRHIQNSCSFWFVSLIRHPGAFMASRLLHRLRRSFFKDGHEAELEQEEAEPREEEDCDCEAELEEEEECVTDRLGGTLCFDSRDGGPDDGGEGDRSGLDSDSDFLGESMEEGLSSAGVGSQPIIIQMRRRRLLCH